MIGRLPWWGRALAYGAMLGAAITVTSGGTFPLPVTVALSCPLTLLAGAVWRFLVTHERDADGARPRWSPWRYFYNPRDQRACPHPPHRVRNIHGDEINHTGAVAQCRECGKYLPQRVHHHRPGADR